MRLPATGGNVAELNYVTFDGHGNLTGVEAYNNNGTVGQDTITGGTYSVNGDGTFSGSLSGSYTFNGVMEKGVSQIEYTYSLPGTGGVLACVGKQSDSQTANLLRLLRDSRW